MSPHVAEQAFTRSFSTKGLGDGRGLGLHAVNQFACDVGGSVALQSEAGSGTTVLLNLPAASSA
jgi:C4-dicarboxylate-specific signal transduction histidine kinase